MQVSQRAVYGSSGEGKDGWSAVEVEAHKANGKIAAPRQRPGRVAPLRLEQRVRSMAENRIGIVGANVVRESWRERPITRAQGAGPKSSAG
jgi:hypothetical protein